jgi:KDO2-lipid IV(A) lauroyltransferase
MLDVPHRRIVRRNLKFIHPDWPPEKIRELSKSVFQNLGITTAEILQMTCLSKEDILSKAVIKNEEHLHNAIKKHKGVIIISAHLGNWEMACLFARCYLQTPMAVVAKRLRPQIINRWIVGLRTRFGVAHLYKEGALSEMTRFLRQGHILGILIDQGIKSSESVEVNYFGRTVAATPAAAMLAMRCKSPVLPIFCVRETNSRFTIIVEPPLQLKRTRDLRDDLKTNTQIMMDAIEKAVRAYPEQWFWVHKRWKKHYPQLYPEYMARRRRYKAKKRQKVLSGKV